MRCLLSSLLVILLFTFCGCADKYYFNNLSFISYSTPPDFDIHRDSTINFRELKRFTVVPYSVLMGSSHLDDLSERKMLYYMRSIIEQRGYLFTSAIDSADFVATVEASNDYKIRARQSIEIPVWPISATDSTKSINRQLSNLTNHNAYGTLSQNDSTTEILPANVIKQFQRYKHDRGGSYFPRVGVFLFDKRSHNCIYQGFGRCTTWLETVTVASQLLVRSLINNIPQSPETWNSLRPNGYIGLSLSIFTIDGINYFPAIEYVNDSAKKSDLRFGDLILSIDGQNCRNKTIREVFQYAHGAPGDHKRFTLWRLDRQVETDVIVSRFASDTNLVLKGIIGFQYSLQLLTKDSGYPIITYIVPNSPAEKIGMQEKDIIISINGIDCKNKSYNDILKYARGNPGDLKKFIVQRGDTRIGYDIIMALREEGQ
jgi:hypothetical protein